MVPLEDGAHFEILWPAIGYSESNDCHSELSNKFDPLFRRAVVLWNSCNHHEYRIHYYKFLKLLVRSSLKFFGWTGRLEQAESHISRVINEVGLELKRTDLLDSRFI
jgi:hypothetical protein